MNRPLWVVTLVLATLAGVLLLWQFRDVVVLFLLALSLSAALGRPIAYLVRRGVPRLAAIILVYGAVLALAGALISRRGQLADPRSAGGRQRLCGGSALHPHYLGCGESLAAVHCPPGA